jgi:hypothetical protein
MLDKREVDGREDVQRGSLGLRLKNEFEVSASAGLVYVS